MASPTSTMHHLLFRKVADLVIMRMNRLRRFPATCRRIRNRAFAKEVLSCQLSVLSKTLRTTQTSLRTPTRGDSPEAFSELSGDPPSPAACCSPPRSIPTAAPDPALSRPVHRVPSSAPSSSWRFSNGDRVLFSEKSYPDSDFFLIVLKDCVQKGEELLHPFRVLFGSDVGANLPHQISVVHDPSP